MKNLLRVTVLAICAIFMVANVSAQDNYNATTMGEIVRYYETAKWGQGSPFNNQCWTDATQQAHAKTGCVPTAFAIIMRHHGFPVEGIGNLPNQQTGEVFTDRTYDYSKMPLTNGSNWTTEQQNEVAKLMAHLGHAFGVTFGSGTTSVTIGNTMSERMRDFFNYKYTAVSNQYNNGTMYDFEEWKNNLKNSLDNGCPVPYAADNKKDGTNDTRHMFVVDGYTTEGYFHINFGWYGSSSNGWYKLDDITPTGDDYSWRTTSNGYDSKHQAFFNLMPNRTMRTVTASVSPTGAGTVTVNGSANSAEVMEGITATLVATANSGYTFSHWSKDGTEVGTEMTYSAKVAAEGNEYVANFYTIGSSVNIPVNYDSNMGSVTYNGNIVSATGFNPNEYSEVTLTAEANDGYMFTGWEIVEGTETTKSSEKSITFIAKSGIEVTAHFALAGGEYKINKDNITPNGGNNSYCPTWTYSKAGDIEEILTLSTKSGSTAVNALSKTSNRLYAHAYDDSSNGFREITYTLTAKEGFVITGYSLTYVVGSSYKGEVTVRNATQSLTPNDTEEHTLTYQYANAARSSAYGTRTAEFVLSSTTAHNSQYITIKDLSVTVLSEGAEGGESTPTTYTINVTANPGTGGTATVNGNSSATVGEGSSVTLAATAANGYTFTGWYKDANKVSGDANYTFTPTESASYEARFAAKAVSNCNIPTDNTLRYYRFAIAIAQNSYTTDFGSNYENVKKFWQECEDFMNEVYVPLGMCFDVVIDERLLLGTDLPDNNGLPEISGVTDLINNAIGSGSYDVGLCISYRDDSEENTGLSAVNGAYSSTTKANGYAQADKWVVAHEAGHLFGADHTTEGESSLMDNIGEFFSYPSIKKIRDASVSNGPSNAYKSQVVANNAPTFTAQMKKTYRIPKGACLSIPVYASDADGHSLRYAAIGCSSSTVGNITGGGTMPHFASLKPQTSNIIDYSPKFVADGDSYYLPVDGTNIPSMSAGSYSIAILVNDMPEGNSYDYLNSNPFYSNYDVWDATVEIVDGTAFTASISPAQNSYTAGSDVTVTWGVNNSVFTEDSRVRITMSTDYGKTFSHVLADDVRALDGRKAVTLPNVNVGNVDVDFSNKYVNAVRSMRAGIIRVEVIDGAAYTLTTLSPENGGGFNITGGGAEPDPTPVTYAITTAANPAEGGTAKFAIGTGSQQTQGDVNDGEQITLYATANTGYKFVNWTLNGTEVSKDATYNVTASQAANYVANFDDEANVYVTKDYTVNPTTGNLNNGTSKSSIWAFTTSNEYPAELTIKATDSNGSPVTSMTNKTSGTSGHILKSSDYIENTAIASTAPTKYTLSVSGDYVITGYDIKYYPFNGSITVNNEFGHNETATNSQNDYFINVDGKNVKSTWFTIEGSGRMETLSFVVHIQSNSGSTPTPDPTPITYTITTAANPAEGGTAKFSVGTGSQKTEGDVNSNEVITLYATANTGYKFVNWTLNSTEVSTEATCDVTASQAANYVANFEPEAAEPELPITGTEVNATFADATGFVNKGYTKQVVLPATQTAPAITFSANDAKIGYSTVEGTKHPYLFKGTNFTISVPAPYKIAGYKLTVQGHNFNEGTFTYTVGTQNAAAAMRTAASARSNTATATISGTTPLSVMATGLNTSEINIGVGSASAETAGIIVKELQLDLVQEADEPEQNIIGKIVGINSIPTERFDLSQGLKTGYYLLKQVNNHSDAAGGNGVGWIKADSEAAGQPESVAATAEYGNRKAVRTSTANPDALCVWYVEVVNAENNEIKISTANKIGSWYLPTGSQRQKGLTSYENATVLKYHTSPVTLSQTATPNDGSCFISNSDVSSFIHFSDKELGSWSNANQGSMFMVEFYKLNNENLVQGYFHNTSNINRTDRKLNSFTITDGTQSLSVTNIQTSDKAPVYVDKSDLQFTTCAGATLKFSSFDWSGSSMHAYAYIDYNKDYNFELTNNNDGSTNGEIVSYNYYNGTTITGASSNSASAMGATYNDSKTLPAFTLPSNLKPGEYRMRIKVDWNNLNANYGATEIASNGGCQCDITLVIKEKYTVTVTASEGGTVTINGEATSTLQVAEGSEVAVVATPANGYRFVNWTDAGGNEVSTNATYTFKMPDAATELTANFEIEESLDELTTGYYHIVSRVTTSHEYLYNNALRTNNSKKYTLQSDSKVTTNNGIWHITVNDIKLDVKNGDGNALVTGTDYCGAATPRNTLNIEKTTIVDGITYYSFTEGINCTNRGQYNFTLEGSNPVKATDNNYVTTWAGHPNDEANQWRLELVDTDGKNIYNVVVECTEKDVYVVYGSGTNEEYAFNGGFFITAQTITAQQLTAKKGDDKAQGVTVLVEGNTIRVVDTEYVEIAVSATPAEGGTVTINGEATSTKQVVKSSNVTVEATPASGYHFVNWTDAGSNEVSTDATYTFTASESTSLVANFEADVVYHTITVSTYYNNNGGTVKVGEENATSVNVAEGESVRMLATVANGYEFMGWLKDGVIVKNAIDGGLDFEVQGPDYTLYEVKASAEYVAVFSKITDYTNLEDGKAYRICGVQGNGKARCIYRDGNTLKWKYDYDNNDVNTIFVAQKNGNAMNLISAVGYHGWKASYMLGNNEQYNPYAAIKVTYGTRDELRTLYIESGTSSGLFQTNINGAFSFQNSRGGGLSMVATDEITTDFLFVEVDTYAFQVSAADGSNAKLGTVNLPFATTVPAGVTAYGVDYTEGEQVYMKALELTNNVLPANTPVLVEAEAAGKYGFKPAPASAAVHETGFAGTLEAEDIPGTTNAYILSYKGVGTHIMLYKLSSTSRKINANKAYYIDETGKASALRFVFGETTDIEEVEREGLEDTIYDLQGRKLSEITEPGIYIVNGKKVWVK